MRLLHIVASISPESGGPAELIRMLIRNAPPTDTAEVLTLDDPASPFLHDLPFPVFALGKKAHARGTTSRRWYSPKLLPWLRANRHRFDAALVHGLWQYPGLAARLTLRGHIPYAVFPHGMLDPWFKRDRLKHLKKQLYWLLAETWVLRSAHRVLFTTGRERDLAQHTFWPSHWHPTITPLGTEPPPTAPTATVSPFLSIPKESVVSPEAPTTSPPPHTAPPFLSIPKGSAVPLGTSTAAPSADPLIAFHQRCPELNGKPFLLYLGRIDPKKGCDLLISAFATAKDPNLHLVIAGPDPNHWHQALMHSATPQQASRIHFPGLLTGPAKWGALAACDAFILPSHQENFGIAVVEALASGKPVLISDQVNIAPEILADHCGLVESDTLAGTRRLLDRWLALTPEERAAMGQRARATFATRYDMRHNTAAILNIFRDPAGR